MRHCSALCMVGVQEVAIVIMIFTMIAFVIYKVFLGGAVNSDQGQGKLAKGDSF